MTLDELLRSTVTEVVASHASMALAKDSVDKATEAMKELRSEYADAMSKIGELRGRLESFPEVHFTKVQEKVLAEIASHQKPLEERIAQLERESRKMAEQSILQD